MTRDYNIKCAVKDCENHSNEGQFVGLLCLPCHRFIAGDGGLYSQACRNSSDMIKQAVEAEREVEREACIGDILAAYNPLIHGTWVEGASPIENSIKAICARGSKT